MSADLWADGRFLIKELFTFTLALKALRELNIELEACHLDLGDMLLFELNMFLSVATVWLDTFNVLTRIKDGRANCFCASLLRTQFHMPRHALSESAKYSNEKL